MDDIWEMELESARYKNSLQVPSQQNNNSFSASTIVLQRKSTTMKFQATALAALLLPMAAMAIPNPNANPEAIAEAAPVPAPDLEIIEFPIDLDLDLEARDAEAEAEADISPEALGLEKRDRAVCKIVNSGSARVKCRKGPGFSYGVEAYVIPGKAYGFDCYKRGSCYSGNCTWQRITWDGRTCYVNGYYTDSRCTIASLGKC
ncbi:hypothetical protein BJY00DRAFT_217175 [Aspergillus carlsbadensis]|nr:hypothetical protein BJY00DRAFT_217175 [Aspergillus carlsbadensis]